MLSPAMAIEAGTAREPGLTLPAAWYSDPEIFRAEGERIFRREWQYAGHVERIAERGFERLTLGLSRAAVDTWGPLVFVNRDPNAAPLARVLGDLPDVVAAAGFDFDGLRPYDRVETVVAANWKVVVENFLECYHCPVAHPSFSELIDVDPDAYRLEVHERFSSQIGPVRPGVLEGDRRRLAYDPRGEVRESHFHFLWPNFTLNVVPGPRNVLPLAFVPLDPERTLAVGDYCFEEGVDEEQARGIIEFGNQVGREDKLLVESVHRGLASGAVEHGRLLLSSERLIQHFQRLVERALA